MGCLLACLTGAEVPVEGLQHGEAPLLGGGHPAAQAGHAVHLRAVVGRVRAGVHRQLDPSGSCGIAAGKDHLFCCVLLPLLD